MREDTRVRWKIWALEFALFWVGFACSFHLKLQLLEYSNILFYFSLSAWNSLSLQHRWRRWCISLVCVFVALQLTNVSDLVSPNHVGSNNNNFTKATIASPVRSSRATTDAHFMPGPSILNLYRFLPISPSTRWGLKFSLEGCNDSVLDRLNRRFLVGATWFWLI